MSLSKSQDDNFFKAIVQKYLRLLHEKPLLTKACTSACTGALGNLMSQWLVPSASGKINWRSVLAFALTGFCFVGPVMHNFYRYLEKVVPKNASRVFLKRLLIDRFLYTPFFLIVYLYSVALLEGLPGKIDHEKVLAVYRIAVVMNWKALTIIQFININYVPQQYRVLVGNFISLAWNCYIALKRKA